MSASALIALSLVAGFLIGALPFGYWLGRLRGVNLLQAGSGSIGATNVFRNLGWKLGVLSFLLDMSKGISAILIAKHLVPPAASGGPEAWIVLAGVLAVVSHSFSFWIGFKGGRGVATGLGVVLAVCLPVGVCSFGVWVVVLAITRYVSVASVLGVLSAPLWGVYFGLHSTYVAVICLAVLAIVLRHLPNLRRLLAGTEPRLGGQRKASPPESEQAHV